MKLIPRRSRDFNFMGYKYVWFAISAVVLIAAIVVLLVRGLNFGIDFKGGTEFDIKAKPGTRIEAVRSAAASAGQGDAQIQSAGGARYIIRVPKMDDAQKEQLQGALKEKGGMVEALGVNDVGPGWGAQVSRQALIAVLIFIGAIMIYISLRFEFKMAVTAIIETVHDLIITVGIYALVGRQVTPASVIAVMTILGYSLYDTIVVFDRIKENEEQLTRQSRKTYSDIVNDSVNQVLVRSLNTSLTTMIPIVCILIFGGETLIAFAFPLFIGVLFGTYSSIIVAPPVLAVWKETEPKYRAYREQVERRQAREARVATVVAGGAAVAVPGGGASPAGKVPGGEPRKKAAAGKQGGRPAAGKSQGGRPTVKPRAKPGPGPPGGGGAAAQPKPQPKPKPKPKPQGTQTSKSRARSRTKGPGSGKKKKKKR